MVSTHGSVAPLAKMELPFSRLFEGNRKKVTLQIFLGPRGPLRTPLVSRPVPLSALKIPDSKLTQPLISFPSDSKLKQPLPQYTVHRTLNRINSRTFLAQFGLVLDSPAALVGSIVLEGDIQVLSYCSHSLSQQVVSKQPFRTVMPLVRSEKLPSLEWPLRPNSVNNWFKWKQIDKWTSGVIDWKM